MFLFILLLILIVQCNANCWVNSQLWIDDGSQTWDENCPNVGANLVNGVIYLNKPPNPYVVTQNLHKNITIATSKGFNITNFGLTKWNCGDMTDVTIKFESSVDKGDTSLFLRHWGDSLSLECVSGLKLVFKNTNSYYYFINPYDATNGYFNLYYPIYLEEPKPLITVTVNKVHVIPKSYVQEDLRCVFYSSATSSITTNIFYLADPILLESKVNCELFTKRYICHNSSLSYEDSTCLKNITDVIDRGNYQLGLVYDYIITGLLENYIEKDLVVNNYKFDGIKTFSFVGSGHSLSVKSFLNIMNSVSFKGSGLFDIQEFSTSTINWDRITTEDSSVVTINSLVNKGTGRLENKGINSLFSINEFENIQGDTSIEGPILFRKISVNSNGITNLIVHSGVINNQNYVQVDGEFLSNSTVTIGTNGKINELTPITLIGQNKTYKFYSSSSSASNCVDVISTIPSSTISVVETTHMKLLSNNRLVRYCPSTFDYSVKCHMNSSTYDDQYSNPNLFNLPHCPCSGESCTITTKTGVTEVEFRNRNLDSTLSVVSQPFTIKNALYIRSVELLETTGTVITEGDITVDKITFNAKLIVRNGRFTFTGETFGEVEVQGSFRITSPTVHINSINNCESSLVIGKDVVLFTMSKFGNSTHNTTYIETEETNTSLSITLPSEINGFVTLFARRPIQLNCGNNNVLVVSDTKKIYSVVLNSVGDAVIVTRDSNNLNTQIDTNGNSIKLDFSCDGNCQVGIVNDGVYSCGVCDYAVSRYNNVTGECDRVSSIEHCVTMWSSHCAYCEEGYHVSNDMKSCQKCSNEHTRICGYGDVSYLCFDEYVVSSGSCVSTTINDCLLVHNEKCMLCVDGKYQSNLMKCNSCDSSCSHCKYVNGYNYGICDMCANSTLKVNDAKCYQDSNAVLLVTNGVYECKDGYFPQEVECISCSTLFGECEKCDGNVCQECKENYVLGSDGKCRAPNGCSITKDNKCESCVDAEAYNDRIDCFSNHKDDCYLYDPEGNCSACKTKLVYEGQCVETVVKCSKLHGSNCLRCDDGYYVEDHRCVLCNSECETCVGSSKVCLKCVSPTSFVDELTHYCEENEDLTKVCLQFSADGGCVKCIDGWYRDGFNCIQCDSACSSCQSKEICTDCAPNYFFNTSNKCTPYELITHCATAISEWTGCDRCEDGYYPKDKMCSKCLSECKTCMNGHSCSSCEESYVESAGKCVYYKEISNCIETTKSKCSKCSGWNSPNDQGNACLGYVPVGFTVGMVIMSLVILIVICVVIFFATKYSLKYLKRRDIEKQFELFSIKNSNLAFISYGNVLVNKQLINFVNDEITEIPVGQKSTEFIAIGNVGSAPIKVLFSLKEGSNEKFGLETNPSSFVIRKGMACQFEINIIPKCSCIIDDELIVKATDMKTNKSQSIPLKLEVKTQMSTMLDYEELIQEKKIGQGGFGIVYKGTFRGNSVAIKKMRDVTDSEESMQEFHKEVEMLDKFRSEYIVHFFGAVLIPNKICMVTEFAPFGSLNDYKKKHKKKPLSVKLRVKIVIDAAKGISYLHNNGILHRDIKPDNFLLFSIQEDTPINAKLTDFGSSRNVNVMMTNMTFTKGIGTPIFMAPEILSGSKKYKMPADIFSFAISMYDITTWEDLYPVAQFKFPWSVAEFVSKGNRLPKTDDMDDWLYQIISKCWCGEPKERMDINSLLKVLETNYNTHFQ